jgi:hypothetical protein
MPKKIGSFYKLLLSHGILLIDTVQLKYGLIFELGANVVKKGNVDRDGQSGGRSYVLYNLHRCCR